MQMGMLMYSLAGSATKHAFLKSLAQNVMCKSVE